jgi:hypothetical protein
MASGIPNQKVTQARKEFRAFAFVEGFMVISGLSQSAAAGA